MTYTDRHGRPLAVGQRVRVQVCTGRYGQTAIRQGTIVSLSPYGGVTLRTDFAFTEDMGRFGMHYRPPGAQVWVTLNPTGYDKFNDFEHGHETWTEIIP